MLNYVDGTTRFRQRSAKLKKAWGLDTRPIHYLAITADLVGAWGRASRSRLRGQRARHRRENPFGVISTPRGRSTKLCLKIRRSSRFFRIDHYLGKEAVQNCCILLANTLSSPWNPKIRDGRADHRDESFGVQGRGALYEKAAPYAMSFRNHRSAGQRPAGEGCAGVPSRGDATPRKAAHDFRAMRPRSKEVGRRQSRRSERERSGQGFAGGNFCGRCGGTSIPGAGRRCRSTFDGKCLPISRPK